MGNYFTCWTCSKCVSDPDPSEVNMDPYPPKRCNPASNLITRYQVSALELFISNNSANRVSES